MEAGIVGMTLLLLGILGIAWSRVGVWLSDRLDRRK